MNTLLGNYKWELIDIILQNRVITGVDETVTGEILIPMNRETYYNYIYIIDFSTIIYHKKRKIPESVIENMSELIDMNLLATFQKLSENLLKRVYKEISFVNLINYQLLPMDILTELVREHELDNNHWHIISMHQRLDLDFIETYYGKIDWRALSSNCETIYNSVSSRLMLKRYADKFDWIELTGRGLTEEVLNDNLDKVDSPFCWYNIAYTSRLSNVFIRQHKKKLDKMILFTCQELDEDLILELLDECEDPSDLWNKLASTQRLSTEFIQQYKDNLPLYLLIRNHKILRNSLKIVFG
jgi:hypothetical protein